MVLDMTQFSSQSLPYNSSYLLPHFKGDSQLSSPWETPILSNYDDMTRSQHSLTGSFDGPDPTPSLPSAANESAAPTKKKSRKSGSKSNYKHVPHREKPPHLVARRNARERRRVQAVNTAFSRLRKCVPAENRNKRMSKVKTLHRAIEYIQMLQEMLSKADEELGSEDLCLMNVGADSLNKENEIHQRWLPLDSAWDEENQNSCLSFYDDFTDAMQS
ncbi:protein atonal homolog 7-like [Stegodyphus dumicola]|uniref:protein atonal homolog 7-like n=1 Tax=Stegodyphus dumicola TaxID=202533 RepID=UPI0015B0F6AA|nr:protein atonal homolog 7-like [Stegodyphus dumicola]